ncbi:MAG: hypothetical protein EBR82_09555 [Caulobacteraceae bacterium]|nr:hypothetical protein [Caulobacteraceae bacterium]
MRTTALQVSNAAILTTAHQHHAMPKISALMLRLLSPYLLRVVDDEEPADGGDDAGAVDQDDEVDGADDPDQGDGADAEDADAPDDGDAEDDEGDGQLVVSLGEEPEQSDDEKRAPSWLRDLRKSNREKDRRIRELEAQVNSGRAAQPQEVEVGKEPDIDEYETWNEEGKAKFKKDWADWNARSRAAEDLKRTREAAENQQREVWQRTHESYVAAKSDLKVEHFEDAEEAVKESLNLAQQAIILQALDSKKAALMVYALGSAPKKLKELAAITDPIKFTVAITKLESEMKVSKTKAVPTPERVVRGNVAGAAAVDNQLERLRKEARQTGDYSKVMDFQRNQNAKARTKQSA